MTRPPLTGTDQEARFLRAARSMGRSEMRCPYEPPSKNGPADVAAFGAVIAALWLIYKIVTLLQ